VTRALDKRGPGQGSCPHQHLPNRDDPRGQSTHSRGLRHGRHGWSAEARAPAAAVAKEDHGAQCWRTFTLGRGSVPVGTGHRPGVGLVAYYANAGGPAVGGHSGEEAAVCSLGAGQGHGTPLRSTCAPCEVVLWPCRRRPQTRGTAPAGKRALTESLHRPWSLKIIRVLGTGGRRLCACLVCIILGLEAGLCTWPMAAAVCAHARLYAHVTVSLHVAAAALAVGRDRLARAHTVLGHPGHGGGRVLAAAGPRRLAAGTASHLVAHAGGARDTACARQSVSVAKPESEDEHRRRVRRTRRVPATVRADDLGGNSNWRPRALEPRKKSHTNAPFSGSEANLYDVT
jgi:hypothetical protein